MQNKLIILRGFECAKNIVESLTCRIIDLRCEKRRIGRGEEQPATDHQANDYRVQMICPVIYLALEGVIRWEFSRFQVQLF